jgi:hypothetical protein
MASSYAWMMAAEKVDETVIIIAVGLLGWCDNTIANRLFINGTGIRSADNLNLSRRVLKWSQ